MGGDTELSFARPVYGEGGPPKAVGGALFRQIGWAGKAIIDAIISACTGQKAPSHHLLRKWSPLPVNGAGEETICQLL